MAVLRTTGAPAATPDAAVPDTRGHRHLVEYGLIALLALTVRIAYLLIFKHPVRVGGDAYFYHYGANLLVDGRGFIDAYRLHNGVVAQTADHPPGTIIVLAAASLLGMRSFFWHQLEMCVLGTATVVVIAMIARRPARRRWPQACSLLCTRTCGSTTPWSCPRPSSS
ncbi:MAG: hypothetical protein NVS3B12_30330 [Acidimicrobiales bacterium]